MLNVLFLFTNHSYLYLNSFKSLSDYFKKNGHRTVVLCGDQETKELEIKKILLFFDKVRVLEEKKIHKTKNFFGRNIQYYKFLKSIAQQIESIIDNENIDIVITSNSYHYFVNVITHRKPEIPIYFIQCSAIISHLPKLTIRQVYENFIFKVLGGINLNRTYNRPPFGNKILNYIMWSPLWADNVSSSDFKIYYAAKISSDNKNINEYRKERLIKNILIILNKKQNIGLNNWLVYSEFYKDFFIKNKKFNPTFKVHPVDDLVYCENYFDKFNVTNEEIKFSDYDLVITHWSTLLYEAMINNIPTILINPNNEFDFEKFRLKDFPFFAHNHSELNHIIDSFDKNIIDFEKINNNNKLVYIGNNIEKSVDQIYEIITKNLDL